MSDNASNSNDAKGFRPASRRRNRLAAGVALAALAIGGNILAYSSLDSSESVVQVLSDIPAGDVITSDVLRTVDADLDPTINAIPGDQLNSLIGKYAKVRIVSGSLVVPTALQSEPLVTPGNAIVAIEVDKMPVGLRERSRVRLVTPRDNDAEDQSEISIEGRMVGLPLDSATAPGRFILSVEVSDGEAARIAVADEVSVVLLDPQNDPATNVAVPAPQPDAAETAEPES